jgi:hypothetical protein
MRSIKALPSLTRSGADSVLLERWVEGRDPLCQTRYDVEAAAVATAGCCQNPGGHTMPKITQVATYVALALLASAAAARSDPLAAIRIANDELKWKRAATGVDRANIVGNERNPGIYLYQAAEIWGF